MGDKRDILIPAAGLLIFVGAIVLMIWGDELGVTRYINSIPSVVGLAIIVAVIVIAWRTRGRPVGGWYHEPDPARRGSGLPGSLGSQGLLPLLIISLIAFLFVMFVLSQVLR